MLIRVIYNGGFGNRLFQYVYGRLVCNKYLAQRASAPVAFVHEGVPEFGIVPSPLVRSVSSEERVISAHFEDYEIYKPHLGEIRDFFPKVAISMDHADDLAVHVRLQDTLVLAAPFRYSILPAAYERVISESKFNRLHVVTDSYKWGDFTKKEYAALCDAVDSGPNKKQARVPEDMALAYVNELMQMFDKFDPVVHLPEDNMIKGMGGHAGGARAAFDLLRSFNNIIVPNSTFSWWAATLSYAENIKVFKPWKPDKPHITLGNTDYIGWSGWGELTDLAGLYF